MRSASRSVGLFLMLLLTPAAGPSAQEAKREEAKDREWTLSGEARFRPEYRNNADLDEESDDDLRQGFMRLRLGVSISVREDYSVFVQAQDSRVAGEEVSTSSNERSLDLHQGYLEVKKTGIPGLGFVVGRQEWKYGDERVLGAFGWDNVGRSFDGVKVRYARGRFFLDGLVARVTSRITAGATTGSDLYGLYSQFAARPGGEYEGYLLGFGDHAPAPGETGVPGDTRIRALGARAKDRFGRFDYTVEAVLERGGFRGDDLAAHAAAAQAGLTWGKAVKLRTFGGYDTATGDENSTDGERQEFFNFFPTNHPHYGYADYEGWRNLRSPYVGVSLSRGRHFAQAKAHHFQLDEAGGPWKDAAGNVLGFDPTGTSGRDVGDEVDLTYRYAWKEKAALEAGYSRFRPGSFARLTRGDDPSDWSYLMLTFAF